jgi:hypothetical protein
MLYLTNNRTKIILYKKLSDYNFENNINSPIRQDHIDAYVVFLVTTLYLIISVLFIGLDLFANIYSPQILFFFKNHFLDLLYNNNNLINTFNLSSVINEGNFFVGCVKSFKNDMRL